MSSSWVPKEGKAHVFVLILVDCKVDCTERASPNLLSYDILVDTELRSPVVLAICVLGMGIACFLDVHVRDAYLPYKAGGYEDPEP